MYEIETRAGAGIELMESAEFNQELREQGIEVRPPAAKEVLELRQACIDLSKKTEKEDREFVEEEQKMRELAGLKKMRQTRIGLTPRTLASKRTVAMYRRRGPRTQKSMAKLLRLGFYPNVATFAMEPNTKSCTRPGCLTKMWITQKRLTSPQPN